jgi:hypothetical protein
MVNFEAIKHGVRITDVCARYGIQLRFRGEWASAKCPLPSHKDGNKDKTFQVNVAGNYWKCWSETCNAKNGGKKGGDVINLVALIDDCSEYQAAQKLAEWFHLDTKEKPGTPIEHRAPEKSPKGTTQKDSSDHNQSSASVKGYMADVDAWFDELFKRRNNEPDVDFWKRTRNGVKARLIESFRNGKRQAQGLPTQ